MPFEIVGPDRLLHPALTPSATMESFPPNVDKDLTDQEKQSWNMRQKVQACSFPQMWLFILFLFCYFMPEY